MAQERNTPVEDSVIANRHCSLVLLFVTSQPSIRERVRSEKSAELAARARSLDSDATKSYPLVWCSKWDYRLHIYLMIKKFPCKTSINRRMLFVFQNKIHGMGHFLEKSDF